MKKKWLLISGTILAVLCVTYFGMAFSLSNKFLPGTYINGLRCFGLTAEQVEGQLKSEIDKYKLQIETVDGNVEERTSVDFGMSYAETPEIKAILDKQNEYAWMKAAFQKQVETVNVNFSLDENVVAEVVSNLECMKEENQVAPVDAKLVYENGQFVIVDEVYGTQLDNETIQTVILECVKNREASVNLNEKGCYVQPKFKKDSEETLNALAELNKYVGTTITYSTGGIQLVVDKDEISQWVSADANMVPVISEEAVKAFVDTVSNTYNTPNEAQTLTTPTGKQVSIPNAKKGRVVSGTGECEQLMKDIKGGVVATRSPVLSQEPTPEGQYAWGNTYLEVDIAQQRMWYIKNGSVAFESNVVTGKPGNSTPTGFFQILEKKRDKVLRGEKQPDGSWGYETPVAYWMRVTWSGIGFHDATWQAAFGGNRYISGYGSHGCINMPLSKAKTLYNTISVGTKVIIHK